MPDQDIVISASGLEKFYGNFQALAGLDLNVERGETLGLIGPNGSGKTTFIRILMGITSFDNGSVSVLGRKLPDRSIAPKLGYMTQKEAVYNELTVVENLRFFGTLYGMKKKELSRRISEVIETAELGDHAQFLAGQLSGGLKQRLSLAIALVHDPELLILDEPTIGVDPELRRSFWDHFLELNRRGTTILVTTHNMDEAARARRLVMIRNGRAISSGTPRDLMTRAGTNDLEQAFMHFAGTGGENAGNASGEV